VPITLGNSTPDVNVKKIVLIEKRKEGKKRKIEKVQRLKTYKKKNHLKLCPYTQILPL
jgi:hypothetical protein